MSSSKSLLEIKARSKITQADEWMCQKKYTNALYLYCEVIKLCPKNEKYYINRSRCYLLMNELQKAQNDAKKAIELNPFLSKAQVTLIRCYLAMGELEYAEKTLQNAIKIFPNEKEFADISETLKFLKDNYGKYEMKFNKKKYEEALQHAENCLELMRNCTKYKFAQIHCLYALKRFKEVEYFSNAILKIKPTDENALYFKTAAQCYIKDIEEALPLIIKLKKQLPDHGKTNQLYKNAILIRDNIAILKNQMQTKQYDTAYSTIKKTIKINDNFVKINKELRLTNINEIVGKEPNNDTLIWNGVLDCVEYIKLYGFDLNIFKTKIKFLIWTNEYEDAVEDLNELYKRETTPQNWEQLKNTEKLLKDQLNDNHKILGIPNKSSKDVIKSAALKLKCRYHPDKYANASAERKKKLEEKFTRVTNAENQLSKKAK